MLSLVSKLGFSIEAIAQNQDRCRSGFITPTETFACFAGSQAPAWEPRKRSSSFARQEARASRFEFPSWSLGTSGSFYKDSHRQQNFHTWQWLKSNFDVGLLKEAAQSKAKPLR
jgi:hypothetical protein